MAAKCSCKPLIFGFQKDVSILWNEQVSAFGFLIVVFRIRKTLLVWCWKCLDEIQNTLTHTYKHLHTRRHTYIQNKHTQLTHKHIYSCIHLHKHNIHHIHHIHLHRSDRWVIGFYVKDDASFILLIFPFIKLFVWLILLICILFWLVWFLFLFQIKRRKEKQQQNINFLISSFFSIAHCTKPNQINKNKTITKHIFLTSGEIKNTRIK